MIITPGHSESLPAEPSARSGDFVYSKKLDHVERQLSKQHIQMIALAGIIGTGLFFGLGQILAVTGPLGSLLVFIHMSTVLYATMLSIGEMTTFAPISGSLLLYTARWLDPAAGFALGWNYFLSIIIAIPAEITAFAAMVQFWDTNVDHIPIYISVIVVALLLINLFGVRWFGHSEVFFASLKIALVVGLIIGGLVISLGGGPDHQDWVSGKPLGALLVALLTTWTVLAESRSYGFQFTLEPGATGRFVGLLMAITPAAFAMGGIELVSITAAEAQQPRTSIIKAMRTVVFRLVFFFIFSVIVVGMLVPSNDPSLLRPGMTAGQSPFVIAFQRAGVKVLPSIINGVLITSAFSAANTFVFSASRILYGFAVQNKAPKIFTMCTKTGVPWVAVLTSWSFSTLAFMNVSASSGIVFNWFLSAVAMGGFIGWIVLNTTYLRYYYGLRRQDIVPHGIYRSPLQPYAAMWAIFWVTFFILVSGMSVFWNWNAPKFVAAYINLPIFLVLFLGYKLWYKTKMIPLAELDFISDIPTLEETGDEGLLTEKPSFAKRLGELI